MKWIDHASEAKKADQSQIEVMLVMTAMWQAVSANQGNSRVWRPLVESTLAGDPPGLLTLAAHLDWFAIPAPVMPFRAAPGALERNEGVYVDATGRLIAVMKPLGDAAKVDALQRELLDLCHSPFGRFMWLASRASRQRRIDEIRKQIKQIKPDAALYLGRGPLDL